MLLPLLALTFGTALLLSGANLLVKGSHRLATIFKLSPLFISLTLVAFGTSLPELTVSTVASTHNDPGLALGNLIGSNITNSTLILGMAILAGSLRIGTTKTQRNAWLLLAVTFIFIFTRILPRYLISPGSVLIGIAIGITLLEYWYAAKGRTHEDYPRFFSLPQKTPKLSTAILATVTGIATLVLGGNLLVTGTELLSQLLNVSTTILGLTLTSLATSLPELTTTVVAQRKGREKIAMGNLLGSNIYNLAFVGGLVTLKPPLNRTAIITSTEIYFLILSSIIVFATIKIFKGKTPPHGLGSLGIILFIIYLISILTIG
jgi:cation:H+ antiporter